MAELYFLYSFFGELRGKTWLSFGFCWLSGPQWYMTNSPHYGNQVSFPSPLSMPIPVNSLVWGWDGRMVEYVKYAFLWLNWWSFSFKLFSFQGREDKIAAVFLIDFLRLVSISLISYYIYIYLINQMQGLYWENRIGPRSWQ